MFGKMVWNKTKDSNKDKRMPQAEQHEKEQHQQYAGMPLSSSLQSNADFIKQELGGSKDITFRRISLKEPAQGEALIVYVQGFIDDQVLNEHVIQPLLDGNNAHEGTASTPDEQLDMIKETISLGLIVTVKDWAKLFSMLFLGGCIVMLEGSKHALFVNASGGMKRSITEPQTEMTVRGPREGFTESLLTNTAMVRRKLRSPKVWTENMVIGTISQTPIGIMYIKGLADENVLADLRERLKAIDIDGILETNYIEELISDQKWTLFPTVAHNERPDVIAGYLLEGRIAILVDGTPFALAIPAPLNSFFQAAEDYYQRYDISTFLRMLRFVSFIIALLMPSIYVAIVSYHQEMIPTPLLIKLAAQREGVPFPAYLEAFIMEFIFEILREAVLRMPSAAGNTISIVGALVIGQSVVEAGIMSPSIVIVVSLTAISSFVTPAYSVGFAARLLRFLLLLASSTLGFYGIGLVILIVLLHLSNLRTFGMPYLKPIAPFFPRDMKDTFVRVPFWLMKRRPQLLATENNVREDLNIEPREEAPQ